MDKLLYVNKPKSDETSNNSNQEQFSQNERLLRKISVNPPTSESLVRFHESIQRMSSVVLDLQRLPISRMGLEQKKCKSV